jgi:hypothetical protein
MVLEAAGKEWYDNGIRNPGRNRKRMGFEMLQKS